MWNGIGDKPELILPANAGRPARQVNYSIEVTYGKTDKPESGHRSGMVAAKAHAE
jgi:hypothetical protein